MISSNNLYGGKLYVYYTGKLLPSEDKARGYGVFDCTVKNCVDGDYILVFNDGDVQIPFDDVWKMKWDQSLRETVIRAADHISKIRYAKHLMGLETNKEDDTQIMNRIIEAEHNEVIVNDWHDDYAKLDTTAVETVSKPAVTTKRKRKKFIIGKKYGLRIKSVEGSENIFKKFILVQKINEIKGQEVNILIMKAASDEDRKKMRELGHREFCLNRTDCQKFHIKYEPHLEVYSSELNWIECKE